MFRSAAETGRKRETLTFPFERPAPDPPPFLSSDLLETLRTVEVKKVLLKDGGGIVDTFR